MLSHITDACSNIFKTVAATASTAWACFCGSCSTVAGEHTWAGHLSLLPPIGVTRMCSEAYILAGHEHDVSMCCSLSWQRRPCPRATLRTRLSSVPGLPRHEQGPRVSGGPLGGGRKIGVGGEDKYCMGTIYRAVTLNSSGGPHIWHR
jgi:hypothetical protein